MSQAGIIAVTDSNLPPDVPTTFRAQNNGVDNGNATPASNIIRFNVTSSTDNNTNGLQASAAGSTVLHQLTNRTNGSGTTSGTGGSQTVDLYTFSLGATPGVYLMDHGLVGFNVTDSLGVGDKIFQVYRTDGVTATKISGAPGIIAEESTMTNVLTQFIASGNNIIVRVTGIDNKTINWYGLTTYIKVS